MRVQAQQCATCIYRRDSPLDLRKLEAEVADPHMAGHFAKFRACHHADDASVCCRGFWDRHEDHFDAGQLAQRLGMVRFVKVDDIGKEEACGTSSCAPSSARRSRSRSAKT